MRNDIRQGLWLDQLAIYHNGKLLVSLDHHIAPGEVLTVMGPSGVGKSTLLSAVTGSLAPVFHCAGKVFLEGRAITELPPHLRQIGVLFQDALLFPHMSVGTNLAFGLTPGGRRTDRRRQVKEALAQVGMDGFADRDPETLSGGQRARVALMRTLLSNPKALLLDEAFSGLDATLRSKTRMLVFNLAREKNLPVLMVTHDQADADAAGGDVVILGA